MKASLAVASLFALMLASPCMAGDDAAVKTVWERDPEPAPPMTITHINGKATDPLIAFLEAAGNRSMIGDVVMVVAFGIHSSVTPPPPAEFDRAYSNSEIIFDLPGTPGTVWGLAEIPTRKGGKCRIHLAPLGTAVDDDEGGIEILDQVALPQLIRHEMAHCAGPAIHPGDDPNEWVAVSDADRAKVVAIARQTLRELTGQDAVPEPARNTTSPPKPQRDAPSRGPCMGGCGY